MADNMSIDKKDPTREGSEDSMDLNSPTPEAETGAPQENVGQQKRKGGRKPIYATSEERKQRNRQAQAAFRERRTEYIKQLEETIRVHETNLHNLQTAHRSAADECLMLRYKNSLLERILLEKEQEYDAQADMVEDQEPAESGPGPYPEPLPQPPSRHLNQQIHPQQPQQNTPQPNHPGQAQGINLGAGAQQFSSMTQLLDPRYVAKLQGFEFQGFVLELKIELLPRFWSSDTGTQLQFRAGIVFMDLAGSNKSLILFLLGHLLKP
ncbi:hypothetical protein M7I_7498 [Glarea lozoyensis 74030]|uniref:BZIP domain-containing protein n=1 Tax=Glarea lozoyensis (strain ATCC 74030 / MF5533) TaxID=1104152 RepID=H0EXG3_GLAL7|nr:hypothetical protein M7I_7498 [Glarea lozoyensis 74030]